MPEHDDTLVVAPRPSLETDNVYDHARRAIEYTLRHMGANGLPLLGAGDWNDGIDALGAAASAPACGWAFSSSTCCRDFIPIARVRGDETFALRCGDAREALRGAWKSAGGAIITGLISPTTGRRSKCPMR